MNTRCLTRWQIDLIDAEVTGKKCHNITVHFRVDCKKAKGD